MGIRVSVVVPVHNPGVYIEALIASLFEQTMVRNDYEVIFVDDGSTDDTPARLDRLAQTEAQVTVVHQPNSGWPGRPRNVGIDLARGDYTFFADQDDWFGREALARMADYADQNCSDVLVGRYAGHHRSVAKALFSRSRPSATLTDTPLMDSLTPHKLFRTSFLKNYSLRFPEGRRRLEDHVFVVRAYFLADRISVLADYHCYFHTGRTDAGNAGYQRIDPPSYYRYVREVVDIIVANTEPGPLRERCLRRPLRQEILARLDGAAFLGHDEHHQRSLFDEGRALTQEMIPPEVDRGLSPPQRVRATLMRTGQLAPLLAYVEHQVGIRAQVTLSALQWDAHGRLGLEVDAALVDRAADGRAHHYRREDDRLVLTAPTTVRDLVPSVAGDCTSCVGQGRVHLVLRRREDSEEWSIPTESIRRIEEIDTTVRVSYHGRAHLDPLTLGGGRPLTKGVWDVYAKITECGWSKQVRLGSDRGAAVAGQRRPAVLNGSPVVPYWTQTYDNLSIEVVAGAAALVRAMSPTCELTSTTAGTTCLRLVLNLEVIPAGPVTAEVRFVDVPSGRSVDTDLEVAADGARGQVVLTGAVPVLDVGSLAGDAEPRPPGMGGTAPGRIRRRRVRRWICPARRLSDSSARSRQAAQRGSTGQSHQSVERNENSSQHTDQQHVRHEQHRAQIRQMGAARTHLACARAAASTAQSAAWRSQECG